MTFPRRVAAIGIVVAAVFCVDRILKWWSMHVWERGGFFIGRSVGVLFQRNEGIAYGIPLSLTVVLVVIVCLLVAGSYFLVRSYRQRDVSTFTAVLLIVSGACSNGLDRLYHGYVIDYFSLTSRLVFNISDVMISAGVIWLLVGLLFRRKPDVAER